jgi:hypothetical protein
MPVELALVVEPHARRDLARPDARREQFLRARDPQTEAIRVFERGGSAKKVNAAFLALIDRGFAATKALETSAGKASARG